MAHHGAPRNPRLTRLLKKRGRVVPQSSPVVAHHRQTPGVSESNQGVGVGQHDTGRGDDDEVIPGHHRTGESEDLPKVLATVVNVIDGEYRTSTKDDAGVTMPSWHPLIEASLTAFPAYSLPTADTPTLTSSRTTSTASATLSAPTSAITSRPLINSSPSPSLSSPSLSSSSSSSSSSSGASSPPSSDSGSIALSSTTSGPSRVTRSSTKTTSSINSTTTSSTTSSSSISSTISSITSSTTNYNSVYTSSIDGFGGGGGSVGTGSPGPTTTDSGPSQPPTGAVPPTTGRIVGGVVGSVAGAVMLVVLAMLLIRRRAAMRMSPEALPSSEGAGPGAAAAAAAAGGGSRAGEMTSRFSRDSILTASYFAPAFMKKWRDSSHTDSTLVSSGGGSERGFQKVSGRKIPSVLTSGGDGYGGGYETVSPYASEPSMTPGIPGSPVIPRSPSQPPPSTPFGMPLDVSYTRETEENDPGVIIHDSPARTPLPGMVTVASGGVPINIPRAHSPSPRALSPQRPDTLNRSHSSFDASRGSRFTEGL